jgi:hypothetical protein
MTGRTLGAPKCPSCSSTKLWPLAGAGDGSPTLMCRVCFRKLSLAGNGLLSAAPKCRICGTSIEGEEGDFHAACRADRDRMMTSQRAPAPPRTGLGAYQPPNGVDPEHHRRARESAEQRYGRPW